MDKNEDSEGESDIDRTDILIYIQNRLTKLEKECSTSLLIIKDLQKQLRSKSLLSYHQPLGPLVKADINNVVIPSEKVTRLTTLVIPESGVYIISATVNLHSYKCVKFQYLSLGGAISATTSNEPTSLSNHLKIADKSANINKTVELQKGDVIEVDFYHLSTSSKKIIRSNIEAIHIRK
jgi:hypothetical protein